MLSDLRDREQDVEEGRAFGLAEVRREPGLA